MAKQPTNFVWIHMAGGSLPFKSLGQRFGYSFRHGLTRQLSEFAREPVGFLCFDAERHWVPF